MVSEVAGRVDSRREDLVRVFDPTFFLRCLIISYSAGDAAFCADILPFGNFLQLSQVSLLNESNTNAHL